MKKAIYLGSWLILTATDAILGYKTAVSDFGIGNESLAIIWALGFSLMSVPMKVIYDRIVETAYKTNSGVGKSIFILFAITWLFVFYNAYTGISDLRKRDMDRLQLRALTENKDEKNEKIPVTKIENSFDYRLARKRLVIEAKKDSIVLASRLEERKQLQLQAKRLMEKTDGNGFLYFNILLILSASICLSLGMEEEKQKQTETSAEASKKEVIEITPIAEEKTPETPEKPTITKEIVRCNSCKRDFNTIQAYNGHFRNNKDCEKGDYSKIKNQENYASN